MSTVADSLAKNLYWSHNTLIWAANLVHVANYSFEHCNTPPPPSLRTHTCLRTTQVAESTKEHLEFYGLSFEYRGSVNMKGKGGVKTYFVGKKK